MTRIILCINYKFSKKSATIAKREFFLRDCVFIYSEVWFSVFRKARTTNYTDRDAALSRPRIYCILYESRELYTKLLSSNVVNNITYSYIPERTILHHPVIVRNKQRDLHLLCHQLKHARTSSRPMKSRKSLTQAGPSVCNPQKEPGLLDDRKRLQMRWYIIRALLFSAERFSRSKLLVCLLNVWHQ